MIPISKEKHGALNQFLLFLDNTRAPKAFINMFNIYHHFQPLQFKESYSSNKQAPFFLNIYTFKINKLATAMGLSLLTLTL